MFGSWFTRLFLFGFIVLAMVLSRAEFLLTRLDWDLVYLLEYVVFFFFWLLAALKMPQNDLHC